jgi:hypothetical protein
MWLTAASGPRRKAEAATPIWRSCDSADSDKELQAEADKKILQLPRQEQK